VTTDPSRKNVKKEAHLRLMYKGKPVHVPLPVQLVMGESNLKVEQLYSGKSFHTDGIALFVEGEMLYDCKIPRAVIEEGDNLILRMKVPADGRMW
jgi:hypothetical protein